MSANYYGATARAEQRASELLNLDYTGREQDWELEFASPTLIEPILGLMEATDVDLEVLSALALLLIASFQGCAVKAPDRSAGRFAALMGANPDVRERMQFYWIDLQRADDFDVVRRLLSG